MLPGGNFDICQHLITVVPDDSERWLKLNVFATRKHGTLEFRHPRMSTCADEVRALHDQLHTNLSLP
jgi:hypothetical protein